MSKAHWSPFAKGKRQQRGVMNKTEQAYADHLEQRKLAGEVLWYTFEGMTFKLAKDSRYTPDFNVMLADSYLEMHEVKGYWDIAAKVRIRVAADKFPFRFVAKKKKAKKDGGGWSEQEF